MMTDDRKAQMAAAILAGTTCQSCWHARVINGKWRCSRFKRRDKTYRHLPQWKTCEAYRAWERIGSDALP